MRDLPPLFSFLFTKSWELSAKNGHQKTGKVHQVSKVTAVTQYFSLAAAATAKTRIAKSVVTTCQNIHKKNLAFCVEWLLR